MSGVVLAPGAPRTIGDWIRDAAQRYGDRTALDVVGREKTYLGVDRDSDRMAAGLHALGLARGERVCVMMRNSLENIDVWFALCKSGLIEVPVNTAARGFALRYLLEQSQACAVVCDAEFAQRVTEAAEGLELLRHIVVHGEPGADPGPALADLYLDEEPPRPTLDRTDTAVLLYTSGTTGPSKGVVLGHEANLNLARHTAHLMGYTPEDRLYTAFPLFHINAKYTSVMAAMEAGGMLVMDDRFSAGRFWDICREKRVTAFNYQGALLMMLYKQPELPDDADNPVRAGFGAPCPVEIWEPFERRFGVRLTEVYGMTEIAIATQRRPEDDAPRGSAGRESPNFTVAVVDEHDRPVPPGEPGEIVVRPKKPGIMIDEYFRMPEETVRAFRNLWFHTGDRGRMDADGVLYFMDRLKDSIRRRGENISSWEVEQVVCAHPDVAEAAAYAVPSELGEDEVMIAVVAQPGAAPTPEQLLDHCQEQMAYFAVPRFVRFLDELPKTPSQRVQKFRLREDGVTADNWDRDAAGYTVRR
ncbi:AMP-binding protein [Pseudonocardia parietis]|uniref:Crotonobetaine/carnitine-CoA ligase n=1 Tax=Pseudonocardia parietis TaxID=570936 RepID=A0ABS4VV32_9PSEU|nr:AMP-binding protein [Pseudonocardia parietis]MBP2367790.1 crotonobetaine/carnitine-CoA ligase [Pseudonocardia parietis]